MIKLKSLFVPTKENHQKPYLLSKVAIIFYTFVLVFVNSFGGLIGLSEVEASSITPENIIVLTNQERLGYGLNTLSTNAQLSAAALAKANDMFEKQYWDHFGPNGESPWQFIRATGYNYVYAGENLAKGFRTAEGVHEAWMASPTHKANIVSGNYKDIGVAVVEGELLGKQTTLVVQMFGNLTSEVYSATQTPEETKTPSEPSVPSSTEKVVVNDEAGEIKSIRITSPQAGTVITDPSRSVKGDTENAGDNYVVEVYDQEDLVGDTTATSPEWEFTKGSDWSEGEHEIVAQIKGEDARSEKVAFIVDSRAPILDPKTLLVKKEEGFYTVSFTIEGEWEDLQLVIGSEVVDIEYEKDGDKVTFLVPEVSVKGAIIVVLSDKEGNTSELEISEYFVEDEEERKFLFPSISLSTRDGISLGIVSFVLILIIIEIFVYWRKGRMKDAVGELFTIGVWWIVLTMAIFNGFSGSIN
ncbi:MAG TPA: CAP domain-containing protein [Candidatus Dojkabacteria bacterium]|nr:CAP domain-containing protein [Candidatus Dojkabacteria bacterium]